MYIYDKKVFTSSSQNLAPMTYAYSDFATLA